MLKGKTVLLGISGSISAYKMAHLASLLKQAGAETYVIMTRNACRFIDPIVFDTLTGHRTVLDDFDRTNASPVSHLDLPKAADVFLIAPASANIIAKAACGIAEEMFQAVTRRAAEQDFIIMAAAVADFRPAEVAGEKIKKKKAADALLTLPLERTRDILLWCGEHKREGQFLCGFAMETQNLLENAAEKLRIKKADMIVANSLRAAGAGFGTDTNIVTLLRKDGAEELPLLSKTEVADRILDCMAGKH